MEYPEAIDWLYGRQQAGIKLGLSNIRRLLDALGLPAPGAKILHVAGTNGKGSTCALAESVLRAAGHRTGLFTSPHLVSFCERIRIDGAPVAESEAAAGIAKLRTLTSEWGEQPTFFEFATALAFVLFAQHEVDSMVLEVGLGGRLDSTNAVTPDICAITPIALDHCHILGDTLAEIAGEKAGIFKAGVPAVSAPQEGEARDVLIAKSEEAGVSPPLQFVAEAWTSSGVALPGEHQRWNAALAVAALRAGGFEGITDEAIERGLADVRWRARLERFEDGRIVVDGAHNAAGARALVEAWHEVFGEERPTIVFGAAANKELPDLVAPLAELAAGFVLTKADSPRAATPEELAALVPEGIEADCAADATSALGRARATGRPILVAGSLFLAGEVVSLLDGERAAYEPSDQ
jgi:dihydrofolate synthase/folylpolyglutamate synthase